MVGSALAPPGAAAPSSISYWPLSSLLATMSPRRRASSTNFEKRFMPTFFSSNDGSISCMTCLSRSERITSPRFFISSTASTTSSQGSRRTGSSSPTRVRPASSLYE